MRLLGTALRRHAYAFFVLLPLLLASCGGGSSSSVFSELAAQLEACDISFESGIYNNSSQDCAQLCSEPILQNHWSRAMSHEVYLWYDELEDVINPASLSDPIAYFDTLVSNELNSLGTPKDNFHFTVPTDEWEQSSQNGVSASYGISWEFVSLSNPRELLVALVEVGSPADIAGIKRGDRVLTINELDFATTTNTELLNQAIFGIQAGDTYAFTVEDFLGGNTRSVNLTAQDLMLDPVQKVQTISREDNNVGYLLFNNHNLPSEEQLLHAFDGFSDDGVSELVIDLRYNGGGFLFIASQIAYMIAGSEATANKAFSKTVLNDKQSPEDDFPFFSISSANQALPELALERVFVLSGEQTCSASEALINGLRGIDIEVILIGETTCGKPYGFIPRDNCAITHFTIEFQSTNNKDFGDYPFGFSPQNAVQLGAVATPGCAVEDDFSRELGDPLEARFAAALSYIDSGTCPSPPSTLKSPRQAFEKAAFKAQQFFVPEGPHNNMILMPKH